MGRDGSFGLRGRRGTQCVYLAGSHSVRENAQLRSGWFMVVAILVAMGAAATIWPGWGRDVDTVMAAAVVALGFPASCILFVVFRHPLPWGLQRVSGVIGPLGVLGISYLQAFVLLPLVFRWRAAKATPRKE